MVRKCKRGRRGKCQRGRGEYSYGSKVKSRELYQKGKGNLIRQRGYGDLIQQRGYGDLIQQRGYGDLIQQRGYGGLIRQRGYGVKYRQRGHGIGSLFRTFFRLAKPLISTGLRVAKPYAKKAVKHLAKEAMGTTSDVVGDVLRGENFKQSIKKRAGESKNRIKKSVKNKLWKTFEDNR